MRFVFVELLGTLECDAHHSLDHFRGPYNGIVVATHRSETVGIEGPYSYTGLCTNTKPELRPGPLKHHVFQTWPGLAASKNSPVIKLPTRITGTQHIGWNAFESAVKGCPLWDDYEDKLKAVLSIMGKPDTRMLVTQTCADTSAQKCLFNGWHHHLVDWKLG